jgi:hypothetical protein
MKGLNEMLLGELPEWKVVLLFEEEKPDFLGVELPVEE